MMKLAHKKGLHLYQKLSQATLNTLRDYTSTALSIGCLIALPFFLLVVVSVGYLSLAFSIIWMIAQKVWSLICLRLTGYQCLEAGLVFTLVSVTVMINLLG